MRLDTLVGASSTDLGDRMVTGFAIDHRKVAPGNVFGAFSGSTVNGEDFIVEAVRLGAIAVVARREAVVVGALHIADVNPRRRFAEIAARYYRRFPSTVVAVTGTNGKTSTVEMTRQLWMMAGHQAASIGTLGVTTADGQVKTGLTTPDVATFLANMAGLASEGVNHVAYEASSHGLDQHRCEGLDVTAAAFTNFSRDHLDYHGDMESYFAAKMRLFDDVVGPGGSAVVWADDTRSAEVAKRAGDRGLAVLSVGCAGEALRLTTREPTPLGQRLIIEGAYGSHTIMLPLIGAYQAANALVAAGLVIATGGDPATTLANLARLQPVRGRLERATITREGAPVYVDYAHTPDALEAALDALRPHAAGRLILVFGAGGDRDTGKRAQMGAVAARLADVAIVTDDNPRSEDPAAIRAEILTATPGGIEVGDRRQAIAHAIRLAAHDDIVCVAGKGHELGQIVGAGENMRVLAFDDVAVARECAK
jgi:UDP-N-acetylmuramoyl-L-alanyl-D-glutamate--2,6-diaminopimelate ligase